MEHHQLAWYVAGPVLGLCVVACRVLFNARLGVTGGFSEIVGKLSRGSVRFDWRGWFAIGVALGGTVFAVAAGGPDFHGYGWLTGTFSGSHRHRVRDRDQLERDGQPRDHPPRAAVRAGLPLPDVRVGRRDRVGRPGGAAPS